MAVDAEGFFSQVCWTNDDRENTYANVPIFSACDADDFVRRFLACHPRDQRTIITAFQRRYEANRLTAELAAERDWLVKVRDGLLICASDPATRPIRRYFIQNEVNRVLVPLLNTPSTGA